MPVPRSVAVLEYMIACLRPHMREPRWLDSAQATHVEAAYHALEDPPPPFDLWVRRMGLELEQTEDEIAAQNDQALAMARVQELAGAPIQAPELPKA